jgi:hypothetical protein
MDKFDEIIMKQNEHHKYMVSLRKEFNTKILNLLRDKVDQYPELRFCQLLEIMGLNCTNRFNEESYDTYYKLK